jgi:hypothetical protein
VERFVLTAPVPAASRTELTRLRTMYSAQGYAADAALHYGALALGAFERFPRNWPTLAGPPRSATRRGAARSETAAPGRVTSFDVPSPALHALITTLWMFPPAGETVRIGTDELTSRVELLQNGSSLRLTVTVRRASAPAAVAGAPLVS